MSQSNESSFSRIVGGATWVPRITPEEWFVLQIDLPVQLSGLHELFSMQLIVKTPLEALGKTGHFVVEKNRLRIRFVPAFLSAWVVLGERHEIDHRSSQLELNLNCLLDLDSGAQELLRRKPPGVQDETSAPWLVRGTLVSGAIQMVRPAESLIHAARFSARLWPKAGEQIEAIYLAGNQFQMQVVPPLPSQELGLPANGDKPKRRRYQFVGASRDHQGTVSGAIWQQVAVRDPNVMDPQDTLDDYRDDIFDLVNDDEKFPGISVENASVEPASVAQVGPEPGQDVESTWTVREFVRPGLAFTISRQIDQGGIPERFTTKWVPETLLIEADSYVLLDHDEVTSYLETGNRSPLPDPIPHDEPDPEEQPRPNSVARITWTDGSNGPFATYLGDTSLVHLHASGVDVKSPERLDVWQFGLAKPKDDTNVPWKWLPNSWVRLGIRPPTGVPREANAVAARIPSLSQPIQIPIESTTGLTWKLRIDLDQAAAEQVPVKSPVRLRCTIDTENEEISLECFAADLEIVGPPMKFYRGELPDAQSVPNDRRIAPNADVWKDHQLVFHADPTSTPGAIVARWLKEDDFEIRAAQGAVTAYLPAKRALIDPVSPTRGNLIAKPVIRLPIWKSRETEWLTIINVSTREHEKLGIVTDVEISKPATELPIGNVPGLFAAWLRISPEAFQHAEVTISRVDSVATVAHAAHGLAVGQKIEIQGAVETEYNGTFLIEQVTDDTYSYTVSGSPASPATGTISCRSLRAPNDTIRDPEIVQIVESNRDNDKCTITLFDQPLFIETGQHYSVAIGPTRLAIPRDPNHGLIPIQLGKLRLADDSGFPAFQFVVDQIRGTEQSSVLAMFPWGEWGPLPPKWLETGRVRLHHRNLVQEHAEFESSFEDRFPPQGPPPAADGKPQSPLLPFIDFVRAVRDRYTEASGNLLVDKAKFPDSIVESARALRNWLPGSDLFVQGESDGAITSLLKFTETDDSPFPDVSLDWKDGDTLGTQTLKIRKAGDADDSNWLEYEASTRKLELGRRPEVELQARSAQPSPETRRLVNSSASLLFDRHDITAIAVLNQPDGSQLILRGKPQSAATVWNSANEQEFVVPGDDLAASRAAMARVGDRMIGVVARIDGSAMVFEYDNAAPIEPRIPSSVGTVQDVAICENGDHPAVAIIVESDSSTKLLVYYYDGSDWKEEAPTMVGSGSPCTAVAIDSSITDDSKRQLDVAVGLESGRVCHWQKVGVEDDGWSEQLLKESAELDDLTAIKGIAVDVARIPVSTENDEDATEVETTRELRIACVDGSTNWKIWVDDLSDNDKGFIQSTIGSPGPLSSLQVTHIFNIDTRRDRERDPAQSVFITGGSDQRVRLWEFRNRKGASIRMASTNSSVFAVSGERLPFSERVQPTDADSVSNPAAVVAASFEGRCHVWEARSMSEVKGPSALQPNHVLDNLGVLRQLSSEKIQGSVVGTGAESEWTVEKLHVRDPKQSQPQEWKSISVTDAQLLKSDDVSATLHDIRFRCHALKVDQGSLPKYRFDDADCLLGRWGFYSEVKSPDDSPMSRLDRWPRLFGIPIFVTRLQRLAVETDSVEVEFDAVLVNPDEIAVGLEGEADEFDIPGFVHRAVRRRSLIRVKIDTGATQKVEILDGSRVDWWFGIAGQLQDSRQRGASARLARLVGKVALANDQIEIHPDEERCRGLVFGRLWPLSGLPAKIAGAGDFTPDGKQSSFAFTDSRTAEDIDEEAVVEPLVTNANKLKAPTDLAWNRVLDRATAKDAHNLSPFADQFLVVVDKQARLIHRATGVDESIELPRDRDENHEHEVHSADWLSYEQEKEGEEENQSQNWITPVVVGSRFNGKDARIKTVHLAELPEYRFDWTLPGETLGDNDRLLVRFASRGQLTGEGIDSVTGSTVLKTDHGLISGDTVVWTQTGIDDRTLLVVDADKDHFVLCDRGFPASDTEPGLTDTQFFRNVSPCTVSTTTGEPPAVQSPGHGLQAGDFVELMMLAEPDAPETQPVVKRIAALAVPKATDPGNGFCAFALGVGTDDPWTGAGTWNLVGDDTTKNIEGVGETLPIVVQSTDHGLASGQDIEITGTDRIDRSAGEKWYVHRIDDDHFWLLDVPAVSESWTLWSKLQPLANIQVSTVDDREFQIDDHSLAQGDRIQADTLTPSDSSSKLYRRAHVTGQHRFEVYENSLDNPISGPVQWSRLQAIESIENDGTDLIIVATGHGLAAGAEITIQNVTGIDTINAPWHAFPVAGDADRFELRKPTIGSDDYTGGGTWKETGGATTAGIASVTNKDIAPIVVTTADDHGLESGAMVEIDEVTGNLAAKGTWRILKLDDTQFALFAPAELTGDGQGGYWQTKDVASTTATVADETLLVLESAAHGLSEGDRIRTTGITNKDETPWFVHLVSVDRFELWQDLPAGMPYLVSELNSIEKVVEAPEDPDDASNTNKTYTLKIKEHGFPFASRLMLETSIGKPVRPDLSLRTRNITEDTIELTFEKTNFPSDLSQVRWKRTDSLSWVATIRGGSDRQLWSGDLLTNEFDPIGTFASHANHLVTARLGAFPVALTSEQTSVSVWKLGHRGQRTDPLLEISPIGVGDRTIVSIDALTLSNGALLVAISIKAGEVQLWTIKDETATKRLSFVPFEGKPAEISLAQEKGRLVIVCGCQQEPDDGAAAMRIDQLTIPDQGIPAEDDSSHQRLRVFDVKHPVRDLAAKLTPSGVRIMVSSGAADADPALETFSVWSEDRILRVFSNENTPPMFSVGIELSTGQQNGELPNIGDRYTLRARMARTRQLDLFITDNSLATPVETRAIYRLEQGPYRCFLTHPASPSGDRGRGALILWTEGDLRTDVEPTQSGSIAPRLGGAAVWPVNASTTEGQHAVEIIPQQNTGENPKLQGALNALNVIASQIGENHRTEWLQRSSVSHALQQSDESSLLTLLLEGEFTDEADTERELSGTLILKRWIEPSTEDAEPALVEMQAPLRMEQVETKDGVAVLKIRPDASWREKVDPGRSGTFQVVNHPGSPNALSATDAIRQTGQIGFVQLVLDAQDTGNGDKSVVVKLAELPSTRVPLEPDLEPGGVRRVPRQDPDSLQVIHRQGVGSRLRYDIDANEYAPVVLDAKEQEPADVLSATDDSAVMLSPAVNDGNRIVLLEESAWLHHLTNEGTVLAVSELTESKKRSLLRSVGSLFVKKLRASTNTERIIKVRSLWNQLQTGDTIKFEPSEKERTVINVQSSQSHSDEAEATSPHTFYVVADPEEDTSEWINKSWRRVSPTPKLATESLIVLFRPRSKVLVPELTTNGQLSEDATSQQQMRAANEFITVLDNRTFVVDDGGQPAISATTTVLEEQRYLQNLIRRSGAAGVALVRHVDSVGNATFHFVNSPFFTRTSDALEEEIEPPLIVEIESELSIGAAALRRHIFESPQTIDNRLIRPIDVTKWRIATDGHEYRVVDRSDDPYRDNPCAPRRAFRWGRKLQSEEGEPLRTEFEDGDIPAIRMLEETAFRQMSHGLHLPARHRRMSPGERQKLFLPGTIDLRMAHDKPGAVFHQLLQVWIGQSRNDDLKWEFEPAVEFAVREPQQIKVTGCVSGRVEIKPDFSVEKLGGHEQLAKLKVTWDEIIGTAAIDPFLAEQDYQSPSWLRVGSAGNLELSQPPVQLITQFNDEVLSVQPNDAAVPGYLVERRDPDNKKEKFPHPARLFAVTNLREPSMGDHRTVIDSAGELQVTEASDFRVKLTPNSNSELPSAGDIIDTFGIDTDGNTEFSKEPNRASWRVLPTDPTTPDQVRLGRNTLPGEDDVEKDMGWTSVSGGSNGTIEEVRQCSPIRVKLKTDGDLPKSGDEITIPTGSENHYLLLAIPSQQGKYLLFRKTPIAVNSAAMGGNWKRVRARVKPLLQFEPTKAINVIETEPDSSIVIQGKDFDGRLVRVDDEEKKLPAANGAWRAIADGANTALYESSFGNADTDWDGFLGDNAQIVAEDKTSGVEVGPIAIAAATNESPIKITTGSPHGFATGWPAKVHGVEGNTAANDDRWLVRVLDEQTVELYHDSRPCKKTDGSTKVNVSPLIPLGEAFDQRSEQGGRMLHEFDIYRDLGWEETSRPLLQISWAGRVETPFSEKLPSRNQLADLYDPPKQVKFLTPSQLSPKLGFVVLLKSDDGEDEGKDPFALHRTILFGDAAPATKGTGRIVPHPPETDGDGNIILSSTFEFVVKDNREEVIFGLPTGGLPNPPTGDFYLLKYLTTGVTIFDETPVNID